MSDFMAKARCARLCALFAVILLCPSAQALAQAVAPMAEPPGEAYQAAISEALTEYELQHYEEARTLFAKAHALAPSARTWRGLGMAQFELRNYPACIAALQHALSDSTKPLEGTMRTEAEALLQRAREFVGHVVLTIRPSGANAAILVDGTAAVPGEEGLVLSVGERVIDVLADGYAPARRKLDVVGGQNETLLILLNQLATPPKEPATRTEARPLYKNPWLWTAVGVVAVAAVATGTALALRKDPEEHTVKGSTDVGLGIVQTLRFGR
jgi:tetratricopeptide (TPR) repeat protein